jgi:hypothetical protein
MVNVETIECVRLFAIEDCAICVDCTEAKYTLEWRISKQFRGFFWNADLEDFGGL